MLFAPLSRRFSRATVALPLLAALGLGASWVACSSDSTAVANGGDAAVDATPVSDAGVDSADAAVVASGDRIGAVFAISDGTAGDGGVKSAYRAGASFTHVTTPDGTTQSKTVGPCLVETIGDGTAAQEEDISAGVVHIGGGAKNIDLTPMSDNTYAPATGSVALYGGGETLTAHSDGSKDVPAFTTSLTAPEKITLSAPVVAAGALTVTRSAGVTATFSGASSGTVVLYFSATSPTKAFAATCTFPAAAGSGSIPAAVFADFPAGDGTFDFYTKESSVAAVSGWEVHFTASKAVVDPAGQALAGQATFQ